MSSDAELSFFQAPGELPSGSVANSELANMAEGTVKLRAAGAGTGAPVDGTGAQVGQIVRYATFATEAVGGALNDYALDPLADVLRFTASATLSGIQMAVASSGRRIVVANAGGAGSGITVDILNFSGLSTGGNRIALPKASTLRLYPGDAIDLQHGVTGNFWFAPSGGSKAYYRTNSSGLGASRGRVNFVNGTTVGWTNADVSADDEVTITPNVIAGSLTPTQLAAVASNRGVVWSERVAFSATGVTGTLIDVTVWSANAPFALRILDATLRVATAAGTTAALRTASAGGGTVVLPQASDATSTFSTAAAGPFDDTAVATATVAANGSLFLRVDRAVAGELVLTCVRT